MRPFLLKLRYISSNCKTFCLLTHIKINSQLFKFAHWRVWTIFLYTINLVAQKNIEWWLMSLSKNFRDSLFVTFAERCEKMTSSSRNSWWNSRLWSSNILCGFMSHLKTYWKTGSSIIDRSSLLFSTKDFLKVSEFLYIFLVSATDIKALDECCMAVIYIFWDILTNFDHCKISTLVSNHLKPLFLK